MQTDPIVCVQLVPILMCPCRKLLRQLAERRLHPVGLRKDNPHEVMPFARSNKSSMLRPFNKLRGEFVSLGYGVPPEVAAKPHRMDL